MDRVTVSVPDAGPGNILRSATGHAYTPYVNASKNRVLIILNDDDAADALNLPARATITVTDQITGFEHKIRRAACGLGCRCAAEIVA